VSAFLNIRPNLEVEQLGPTVAHLRDVLGFQVDVEEEEMGLVLLHRDEVGVAVVRAVDPAVNQTTSAYIVVTGVDELHAESRERGANVVAELTDHPWGLRDFVVELPGGHRMALGERIA
jgi:predicted enzyme related to lactoylglutathione lyase